MRVGERRSGIGWFSAMCALGLVVLLPLTAALAQAPASVAAPAGEAAPAVSQGTPAAAEGTASAAEGTASAAEGTASAAEGPAPAASQGTAPAEGTAAASTAEGAAAVTATGSAAAPASAAAPTSEDTPASEGEESEGEGRERSEPNLSLSAQLGVGYLSGGHGGLFATNRSPLALDIQVLTVREPRYLIGGALRIELEGAHAVAGIARLQLRHAFGPIELRPGIGLPFYVAPRTMLGPEAGVWGRLTFSQDLALLVALSASAFVIGDDIPKGNTVIMLQVFVGAELFL